MTALNDITGLRFGRLVAVRDVGSNGKRRLWLFQCDCGGNVTRHTGNLTAMGSEGRIANCGCFKGGTKNKGRRTNVTHGMTGSRLYRVWTAMLERCRNPKNRRFAALR